LLQTAAQLQGRGDNNLPVLVFHVLERDGTVPWMQVFAPLKRGLAQRGMLIAKKGALGLSLKLELAASDAEPQLSAARIAAIDVSPVCRMLDQFAAVHPEQNSLLLREIKEGIERRRDTSD
jgi:hypothetical protein